MTRERKNEAAWLEKYHRWQIKVQRDGDRKTFTSPIPGTKGKIAAEKAADKWLAGGAQKDNVRFGTEWDTFIEKKKDLGRSDNYLAQLQWIGKSYLLPALRHRRVSSITSQDWQDRITEAYKKNGLSRSTLKDIRCTITAFASHCRKSRVQMEYPFDLEIPSRAEDKEKNILNTQGFRTLFTQDTIVHYDKDVKCHYIYAWRLCALTGLRIGELCALKKSDVTDGILHISRAVDSYGNITRGKTKSAIRSVPLCREAQAVLADQQQWLKKLHIKSEWLFPNPKGDMPMQRRVYDNWRVYRQQYGIDCSLHELRHTFISYAKSGVPIETLKLIAGHTKSMDTTGRYGHEVEGEIAAAASALDTAFSTIFPPEPPTP